MLVNKDLCILSFLITLRFFNQKGITNGSSKAFLALFIGQKVDTEYLKNWIKL